MPVYRYRCVNCRHEFKKLVTNKSLAAQQACVTCGSKAKRLEAQGAVVQTNTTEGVPLSSKSEIDKAIGEDAAKRWTELEERRAERMSKYDPAAERVVSTGGTFDALSAIGDKKRKEAAELYSSAVKAAKSGDYEQSNTGAKQVFVD